MPEQAVIPSETAAHGHTCGRCLELPLLNLHALPSSLLPTDTCSSTECGLLFNGLVEKPLSALFSARRRGRRHSVTALNMALPSPLPNKQDVAVNSRRLQWRDSLGVFVYTVLTS